MKNRPLKFISQPVVCAAVLLACSSVQAQSWTPTAAGTYDWNDNANWSASPFPNAVDAATAFSVDFANPQIVELNQAITVGSLTFTDNGATTGSSTFNLAAGTGGSLILETTSGNALVSLIAPSTARQPKLTISSDIVVNSNSTFDTTNDGSSSGKQITLSGQLSGSGTITKDGSKGRLAVTGDNSAFTGNWILDGGITTSYFRINADNNLGAVPVVSGNNISVNGNNTLEFTPGTYTIDANRDIVVNSGSLGLAVTAWNTYVTIAGDISGAGGITRTEDKGNSPYILLSGNNTYTGQTIIRDGTLRAGSNTAFGVDSEVVMITGQYDKHGELDLNDFDNAIGSLSGGDDTYGHVDLGSATLTTGSNDLSTDYAGIIFGTGGLTKVGTGTMTLSEANTYTGATTISSGTLALSSTGSIDSSTIAFGVTDAASGHLTTENAAFAFDGTLDLNLNSVTLETGSWTLFDGSAFGAGDLDLADVTSDLASLTFVDNGSGVWSGTDASSRTWTFSEDLGTLNVIPEPTTLGLVMVFGMAMVLGLRHRKA